MLGGGLSRATVFALGIMPYISASIIFQLAGGVVPTIGKMQKDEEGRKKLTQWTRYITVLIALAAGLHLRALHRVDPGRGGRTRASRRALIMVVTLTAGAIFVMWLGEQITERGIGNGDEPADHLLDPRAALAGDAAAVSASSRAAWCRRSAPLFYLAVLVARHRGRRRR